nr:substance-K receptor isoform X3 [Taeniopygia guttata]
MGLINPSLRPAIILFKKDLVPYYLQPGTCQNVYINKSHSLPVSFYIYCICCIGCQSDCKSTKPVLCRYVAIIHPFKPRLSAGSTRVIIGMIWLVAFGLAFPQCFYAEITVDNGTMKCIVVWPDDVGSKHQLAYHIAVIVLIYLLPLMVMFVAYSIIGVTLWSSTAPGNHLNRVHYEHQVNAKKKFVKTMVVVVIIFAVCWLPYHIYFILGSFKEDIYQQKYIQQVYLAVFLLAMSSTMYNPIIYCCLNQRFRSGFKLAFRWCPCIKATEKDKLKLMSPSLYQTTHRKSRTTSFNTETQLNEKEKTSFTLTRSTL